MKLEASISKLRHLCWPTAQLDGAVKALALHSGLEPAVPDSESKAQVYWDTDARLQLQAEAFDLNIEQVNCKYGELEQMLVRAAPALLRLRFAEGEYFIALCGGNRRFLHLLTPSQQVVKLRPGQVLRVLTSAQETPQRQRIARLLDSAEIVGRRRKKATEALLRENLVGLEIDDCWLLRQPSHRSFWQQLRHHRQHLRFLSMITCHTVQVLLFIASWWLIGRAVLDGHVDSGWLVAWVLLLITQIPLSLLTARLQGSISLETGALLKQRLLASALRIDPGKVRHMGSGQILGRVYDAENIEASALQASFMLLLGGVELVLAFIVLQLSLGTPISLGILTIFLLIAIALGRAQYLARQYWTGQRLSMTHRLIEKMLGHRTRLAQQKPSDWHRGEDQELEEYLRSSTAMDGNMTRLVAFLPRFWLLLGITGLVPVFVNSNTESGQIAAALGGVLLGYRAVLKGMTGYSSGLSALVTWEKVRELFSLEAALKRGVTSISLANKVHSDIQGPKQPLCYIRDLSFNYPNQDKMVLKNCKLSIYPGDRVILQGASGSGKSTFANVIAGIQKQREGILLINGYDRTSIGAEYWRRLVASVPQFHENHVLGDSFLFNLLMGDEWPPKAESVRRAYKVCDELGLTPLIKKMPAGMLQTVGEMGWRLSHGEMSRLFIARALLQNSELLVLDESFAALDPDNLRRSFHCVQKYSNSLIVIAHP
ncbi:ATP-binding cassette domain-containing protein [Microbulbifer sp. ANSA002]|uniref:ATP-binding cassette domain-containing protein n=1 Tax=unclassified Microbulbifer TaxID=2619833 RepID=UPI0040437E7F